MKALLLAVAAVIGTASALPAAAQFAKPEDAIKYRKAAFTVLGTHFGRIGAMAAGRIPFDAGAAAANAEVANAVARLPFAAFGDGTNSGDTRAKPEIWSEMDKFRAGATRMQEEIAKLNTAAKGGNLDAIKAAAGEVGKTCKGCHDSYRKE